MKHSVLFWLILLAPASAQVRPPQLTDSAQVSVLTMLPGSSLYEAWGHTGIRVYDPLLGIDQVYNYGTFNFEQPGFYLKFMRGQLDYQLASSRMERVERVYRYLERPIIEQVLNLTPADRQAVFNFLVNNDTEANRYYRYDFFFDNCSTRPRDVLEHVLNHRLNWNGMPPSTSFRTLLDTGLDVQPWSDFGIDLLLGTPADQEATLRQAMYLPLQLMAYLDEATIELDGTEQALVARTDTVFWLEGADQPATPYPWPQIVMWSVLLLGVGLTVAQCRRRAKAATLGRWFDAVLFGLIGLAGSLMLALWFGTEHAVTASNWNLLWAWPTHLIAVYFIVGRKRIDWYWMLTAIGALLVVIGWALWPQALHPATFPLVVLIGVRAVWLQVSP